MVFFAPSSSDMPARLPENVITFGTPAFAAKRNIFAEPFLDLGVVFHPVHGVGNVPAARVTHAAHQSVAPRHFEFVGIEQVDSLQADLCGVGAELVERSVLVTPAGNRLLDPAFARHRGGGLL